MKCIASSGASLPKGDKKRKSHLEPGIVLGTNETDFMGCVTMSPASGRQKALIKRLVRDTTGGVCDVTLRPLRYT